MLHDKTNLSVPSHLDPSIQELIEVLTELPRSHCQLAAGASGGVDHLACRLVQVCCRLVQLTLGLLKRLGGWRDLKRGHEEDIQDGR